MNKTRVEDMMIEMIQPKISEIEERFNSGIGLTQDDINTLLLKSQYNHINHLDSRLDEVADSVQALEVKFSGLEVKFAGLEARFSGLEGKFELLKLDLESKFDLLRSEVEATIQKALNRNMLTLIAVLGGFMTLSQLIDKLL